MAGARSRLRASRVVRDVGYVALSFVCVSPLIVLTGVNAAVQWPPLFLLSLALYAVVLLTFGPRFERWRTTRVLGEPVAAPERPRRRSTALYALVDVVVGVLGCGLVVGWLLAFVRNVVLYPLPGVGEWGHPYPDPSWGGPTWQGAIAVHTGATLLSLGLVPPVMRGLALVQATLVARLLGARPAAAAVPVTQPSR